MKIFSSKLNLTRIVIEHWDTFGNIDGRGKFHDWFTFYLVPMIGALAYGVGAKKGWIGDCVPEACWNAALTVCAIFIPLAMTMLINLHSLRREMAKDTDRAQMLVRQLSCNSAYEALVAIVILVYIVVVLILDLKCHWLCSVGYVGLFGHLILTLFMIVKRFYILLIRDN